MEPLGSTSADVEALAAKLFAEMVDDLVQDITFLAVKSIKRARQPCSVCHTFCQTDHGSAPSTSKAHQKSLLSHSGGDDAAKSSSQPAGTGSSSKADPMLSCQNCKRPIASSRYAHHLSGCLGLGNSRRGAMRASAQRSAADSESSSPYFESDGGDDTKGKNKLSGDSTFKLDAVKSKKRPLDGKPKSSPKKQKLSPTKAAIPAHLQTNAPAGPPKGTGPPRRVAGVLPLKPGGPVVGASPNASSRPLPPFSPNPPIPSKLASSVPAPTGEKAAAAPSTAAAPAKTGTYLEQYGSHKDPLSNGWLHQAPVTAPVPYAADSPPHADADEIVDSSDED